MGKGILTVTFDLIGKVLGLPDGDPFPGTEVIMAFKGRIEQRLQFPPDAKIVGISRISQPGYNTALRLEIESPEFPPSETPHQLTATITYGDKYIDLKVI